MLKTSTIAACVLALSGAAAFAQTSWVPPGPNNPPAGAGGGAAVRDIGSPSANVIDTYGGQTRSTTILSQSNKQQSAAGMASSNYAGYGAQGYMPQQAQMSYGQGYNTGNVFITDEYGYQYNSRGERIGRVRR